MVATAEDDLGNPVGGASVTVFLYSDGSDVGPLSGVTDGSGRASMTLRHAPAGCHTGEVVSVTASGLTWDGNTPANGSCE